MLMNQHVRVVTPQAIKGACQNEVLCLVPNSRYYLLVNVGQQHGVQGLTQDARLNLAGQRVAKVLILLKNHIYILDIDW